MIAQKIPCPNCDGKGKVRLSEELQTTLDLFRGSKEYTADTAHITLGLGDKSRNAVNNRLEELRKLKLIDRIRKGRSFHYFKISPPKK